MGGAGVGYHRAGFEVVGVDINPQPDYPFEFHRDDAILFVNNHHDEFDFIHASPPCQKYTTLVKGTHGHSRKNYPDLVGPTRVALDLAEKPYVMENVATAPIRGDVVLCGLTFGLKVFRHRKFELGGWACAQPKHESHRGHRVAGWRHGVYYDGDIVAVYGQGGGKGTIRDWQNAMGIDWTENRKSLAEAIPPAYTQYVGNYLMKELDNVATAV